MNQIDYVKSGTYKHRPRKYYIHKLPRVIKHVSNTTNLIRAIVYSITTPLEQRQTKLWQVVKATASNLDKLEEVAIYNVLPPTKLSEIYLIDFSMLFNQGTEIELLPFIQDLQDYLECYTLKKSFAVR